MRGSTAVLAVVLAAGLALVAVGLWVFDTHDVTAGPCPQDVPVRCTPAPRVASPPMGLLVALGGIGTVAPALFLLRRGLRWPRA